MFKKKAKKIMSMVLTFALFCGMIGEMKTETEASTIWWNADGWNIARNGGQVWSNPFQGHPGDTVVFGNFGWNPSNAAIIWFGVLDPDGQFLWFDGTTGVPITYTITLRKQGTHQMIVQNSSSSNITTFGRITYTRTNRNRTMHLHYDSTALGNYTVQLMQRDFNLAADGFRDVHNIHFTLAGVNQTSTLNPFSGCRYAPLNHCVAGNPPMQCGLEQNCDTQHHTSDLRIMRKMTQTALGSFRMGVVGYEICATEGNKPHAKYAGIAEWPNEGRRSLVSLKSDLPAAHVMAHELGHNFGIRDHCTDINCVMNPLRQRINTWCARHRATISSVISMGQV